MSGTHSNFFPETIPAHITLRYGHQLHAGKVIIIIIFIDIQIIIFYPPVIDLNNPIADLEPDIQMRMP